MVPGTPVSVGASLVATVMAALAANEPALPGVANVKLALLPAASRMVLPLRVRALELRMSRSTTESPACTVYVNVSVLVPLPPLKTAFRSTVPVSNCRVGVPPVVFTITGSLKATCSVMTLPTPKLPLAVVLVTGATGLALLRYTRVSPARLPSKASRSPSPSMSTKLALADSPTSVKPKGLVTRAANAGLPVVPVFS